MFCPDIVPAALAAAPNDETKKIISKEYDIE
jgi:hypothetical protein